MAIVQPSSTLEAIQTKVRRLTRSPSTSQLSDEELQNYINTSVVYDFPEHLRMFNLKTTFSFYTNPGQDVYPTDIVSFGGAVNATTNPLYNFQNIYLTMHPPVYIAGYEAYFTQHREQFYGIYPMINNISSIGPTGNGAATQFSGVINTAIPGVAVNPNVRQFVSLLQNEVLFSSVDLNGNGLAMIDVPLLDSITGMPTIYGNLYRPDDLPPAPVLIAAPYVVGTTVGLNQFNYINYVTGQFVVTFDTAPAAGVLINSQTVPLNQAMPQSLLFYDNKFVVRPMPDQPYKIEFEAYVRPTALLQLGQSPQLEEWWQYIAYLASKKVFEDRMDLDSVALILPELNKQERMCLRRTLVQLSNQRTRTIYSDQMGKGNNGAGWWGGGAF